MNAKESGIIHEPKKQLNYKNTVIAEKIAIIDEQTKRIHNLEQELNSYKSAFWWKVTKPMRVVSGAIKKALKVTPGVKHIYRALFRVRHGKTAAIAIEFEVPDVLTASAQNNPIAINSYKWKPVTFFPLSSLPRRKGGRDILFVMHCLDIFGAPIVLVDMVQFLFDNMDNPVVLSSEDGPLKQKYLDMGVPVIIDDAFQNDSPAFECFARNFDLVVVNTLQCGKAISILSNTQLPVLWWLHEPSVFVDDFRHVIPDKMSEKVKVCAVSNYCAKSLTDGGLTYNFDRLEYGFPDYATQTISCEKSEYFTFLFIGGCHLIKGTDILLDALFSIDEILLQNTRFIFIGRFENPRSDLEKRLHKAAQDKVFIECVELMPREQLWKFYREADCAIVPSRQETVSAVVIEAAIFSKPAICSNQVGVAADHITDRENGYIFPSEDYNALADCIVFAINNREKVAQAGECARKGIYETHFTMTEYRANVLTKIEETLKL